MKEDVRLVLEAVEPTRLSGSGGCTVDRPELRKAWLAYFPSWIEANFKRTSAECFQVLRDRKRWDAAQYRQRHPRRRKRIGGKQVYLKPRGRRPVLAVAVKLNSPKKSSAR